jgi:1-deoxy-D-xylulose-5-phosphate reductoisomerase
MSELTFEQPDLRRFRCLSLAFDACRAGGTMPVVLNAANEVAVEAFLSHLIGFASIPEIVARVMDKHQVMEYNEIDEVLAADNWAREQAWQVVGG